MEKLMNNLAKSYSQYHVIENIKSELVEAGYNELKENEIWNLKYSEKYFLIRNESSIIAFRTPTQKNLSGINMIASHSDSPTFKVKPHNILKNGPYIKLNTEVYGGPILSTWLDRPLTLAGRVVVRENEKIVTKLLHFDEDLLVIPNIAPHMKPAVSRGVEYNPQIDMLPLFSVNNDLTLESLIKDELKIQESDILSYDLFLVNRQKPVLLGKEKNLLMSPRLDDLSAAYATLEGFLKANNQASFNLYVCFDNEEVGSRTAQGANSNFLKNTIDRAFKVLGYTEEEINVVLANSFMISADNAHAVNPNQSEVSDALNRTYLNQGVVVKYNANQSYVTEALTAAYFSELAKKSNVNLQKFANRSDIRGGSTLGNISTTQVSVRSVDIGLPQLAMHSSTEVIGTNDYNDLIKLSECFYNQSITIDGSQIKWK